MSFNPYLKIHPEVQEALEKNQPVVALESTIISHGMPFPENYHTALALEQIIRDKDAIPATIALMNGYIKVGLTKNELEKLAKKGRKVHKTSRRDMAYVLSQKITGATTVASTMIIAQMSGIKVFATGGIGGVHRGASSTMDISADLQELAKTNVAVVCAGVKSILDIGLTLEYLETLGVPVIGYQTDEMPAFFSSKSGFKVDFNMPSPKEIAHFIKIKDEIEIHSGVLITQPVPKKHEISYLEMEKIIQNALLDAKKNDVKGKEITPFLLKKVNELTQGNSLQTNIALVQNNVHLATEIAIEICK